MARIMIENLFKKTILADDHTKTLLDHFQANHVDWMHACGGKGRCTTCKVIVVEGTSFFERPTKAEIRFRQEGALGPGERLSCQARVHGDVRLRVPKEYQLPHIRYSDEA